MQLERAAARYVQIREIEAAIERAEQAIADIQAELADAEDRLKEVRKTKADLLVDLRAAARDEGQLPLLDLQTALAAVPAKLSIEKGRRKKKR